jgi:hypothetical protein
MSVSRGIDTPSISDAIASFDDRSAIPAASSDCRFKGLTAFDCRSPSHTFKRTHRRRIEIGGNAAVARAMKHERAIRGKAQRGGSMNSGSRHVPDAPLGQ